MAECATQTFSGITQARFDCLPFTGVSGPVTETTTAQFILK